MHCLLLFLIIIMVASVYGQFSFDGALSTGVESPHHVTVGDTLELSCYSSEAPLGDLVWKHNGMPLSGNRFQAESSVQEGEGFLATMTLTGLTSQDAGSYECTDAGDYFNRASIRVIVDAAESNSVRMIDPEEDEIYVRDGDTFSLTCEADSGVSITWLLNGLRVRVGGLASLSVVEDINTHKQRSMMTVSFVPSAVGEWTCYSSDDYTNQDSVHVYMAEEGAEELEELDEGF